MPKKDDRRKVRVKNMDLFYSRVPGDVSFMELCKFYLVLRALDKDPIAQDLLDSTGTIVCDLDGNQIYPPIDR